MHRAIAILACALLWGATRAAADPVPLPTGRLADPAGRLTPLEVFPTGVATSPDGKTVVAIAGTAIQGGAEASPGGSAPDAGAGVQVDFIDAASGAVRQVLRLDDAFQDVVYARDGTRVYVAGGSSQTIQELDIGAGGFASSGPTYHTDALVSALAPTPDGRGLWVGEPEAGRVQYLQLGSGIVSRTVAAPAPNRITLSPDGRTLYAADWRGSAITAVDLASGTTRSIPTGAHPTDVAVQPDGTVLVANANDATLALLHPGDPRVTHVELAQLTRRTDAPNAVALGPRGRVYVSLGGDDAVAVLGPHHGRLMLDGLIPTGWYPDALALSPDARTLYVVTARGLGHSLVSTSPYVTPDPLAAMVDGAYGTVGTLETIDLPAGRTGLAALTARTRATLRPASPEPASGNPLLEGPRGPIKHVIYITRENKTYDADLGDLHPGRPDNALVLFGRTVTPNLHALETTFVEPDAFTYQGFASIVGHMWEDAGAVSDVFERAVASNTGTHFAHANDSWHDPSNYPATGLLTVQAYRAGLSVRTYNEELAQQSHLLPAEVQAPTSTYPDYDLHVPDVLREAGWEQEFHQFVAHRCTAALARTYGAACQLPTLEYVYLGNDHTTVVDEPGYPTIQAQVADNDLATGRLIEAVSHSSYWPSTAIFVVEDDPQGTGDAQSYYRGLFAAASPWVKRGYVSHTPYNLTSVVAAADRILGLPPITDFALTSRPLDDLFTDHPDYAPFTADPSGVAANPFTPLPGTAPSADPAHGIYSFAAPDQTDPAISELATWRQVKGDVPKPTPSAADAGSLLPALGP